MTQETTKENYSRKNKIYINRHFIVGLNVGLSVALNKTELNKY